MHVECLAAAHPLLRSRGLAKYVRVANRSRWRVSSAGNVGGPRGGGRPSHGRDVRVLSAPTQRGQRSSRNPGSSFGRSGAVATNHPVRYIHCAMRVSFA